MSKLDQIRQAFAKDSVESNSNNYNSYQFYKMNVGEQAEVRFLPDANEDNPMGFLIEYKSHRLTINGNFKNVPCLSMYGEDCPICKVSSDYYKADDKENGKKYWRKLTHLAQVLVVNDPLPAEDGETNEGKVKSVRLGFQIFKQIKSAIEDGELDVEPYAYIRGTNFFIKKDKQGEYDSYATSKFSRKESDLTEDQIKFVEENLVDLTTLLPPNPGREAVEKMLEADLSNTNYTEDSSTSSSVKDDDVSGVDRIKAAINTNQTNSPVEEVNEDLAQAMIEKIRNRNKQ